MLDPYPQPFPRTRGKGATPFGKSLLACGEGFRVGSTALVLYMSQQTYPPLAIKASAVKLGTKKYAEAFTVIKRGTP